MNGDKEIALHAYVQDQIGKPFEYGVHDCPLFAAGVLDIFSGKNHRENLAGLWSDKKSAWRYMKKNGTIQEYLENEGCKIVDFNHAQTGDFLCMEQRLAHEKKWHSVGVCLGIKAAILTEEEGVILPLMKDVPNATEVLRYV